MSNTKRILVAFILTILFVSSSIHCRTTSNIISGFESKDNDHMCFNTSPCIEGGAKGCDEFCTRMGFAHGHCPPEKALKSDKEYFSVPSFPDRVEFTKPQVPVETNASGDRKEVMDIRMEADDTSYGVIANTFQDLEPAYLKDYKEARAGKVWSIGPVSLCNKMGEDKAERGSQAAIDPDECLKWLDSKQKRSVIYICLGSICNLPLAQLKELGLGLEVLKVGVSVGVEEVMKFGEEEEIGVLVDREGVKKVVEELMGESDDAKERRRRVKELGELAHKAMEEGGSSHDNISFLLQDIMQHVKSKN
ncbi:hypothetical protein AALP_AA4G138200 [Arabis alpina]|uniref:UDP-glycosyltransferases domain-containing protein n=1 Tax=Arabis alpina TaxID=50452 RepID=A0A087H347_ARAAL|nr:hypothetical protein AALP_AA4G138200 [Arabis alpina]